MKHNILMVLYVLSMPVLALTNANAASEVPPSFSTTHIRCSEKTGGVTSEVLACNDAEYAYQSKRMNTAYQTLLRQLSASDKKRLRAIQRNWVLARDGTCSFYYKVMDNEQSGLEHSVCLMRRTAKRAALLEEWLGGSYMARR